MRARNRRRAEQFDVIHFRAALGIHGLPHAPAVIRERVGVLQREFLSVLRDEEKPIAAPGDVAGDFAQAGNVHGEILFRAPAWNVGDRDFAVRMQRGGDDTHRGFNPVLAGFDPSEMRERDNEANRPVPAHAEVADVVEEDDAASAGLVLGLDQQRTDDDLRAARFVDDGGAVVVEVALKSRAPSGQRTATQIGPPATTTRVGSPPVWESMMEIRRTPS